MENVVLTQLSVKEIRKILRAELESYFNSSSLNSGPKEEPDELLDVAGASEFLHLTIPTIYAKHSRGELPALKRHNRIYFSKKDLWAYLRAGRKQTNAETEAAAEAYLKKKGGFNG